MITSRSLDELTPEARKLALEFAFQCKQHGIEILIYCTYRDAEAQDALYALGRTKRGAVVTNLRGGESSHQKRIAFDWVPMLSGKPQWDNEQIFDKCGAIAESVGLKWAGRWRGKLRERCHCEL